MQKTILYIGSLSIVMLTSCVKKYSCRCSTTISAQYYYPHVTETTVPISKLTTKKKGQDMCNNTALQLKANARLIVDKSWEVNAQCVLKDY